MAQINGADSKIVIMPEDTLKTVPVLTIHDCEAAWDELVDADATVTADTSVYKRGTKSAKFVIADGMSAGDIIATDNFTAKDLSGYTYVQLWVYSSVALDAGDIQLLLDNTAQCASPIETLDIPAITATNTWTCCTIALAAAVSDTAIVSVGAKFTVDKGACTIYFDNIRALNTRGQLIPFNTATLGMTMELEESNAIASGRQPLMPTGGTIGGTGNITVELNPFHTSFLKHVFGSCTTTNPGAYYQHVFKIDSLPTGLAIEVQHTVGLLYKVYHCKINSFKLTQNATGKVMCDFGVEVASEEAFTTYTSLDEDPINNGHAPFSAKFGAFYEGGSLASGTCTNMSITLNNDITGEPTIGSAGVKDSLAEGRAKVDFSIETLFKDSAIFTKAQNETESSLKLENMNGTGAGTAGNEKITIEMDEVKYALPQQNIDGPRGMKLMFSGIAYYNDDSDANALTVTVLNSQTAIV
jgi:hypothetical protein